MLIFTARVLLRRWPLVLAAVVVASIASYLAVVLTPTTYESRAQVLFVPPVQQPGVDGPVNPFMAMGAALGVTADIVRLRAGDDSTRAELVDEGALEDYEVVTYLAENGGPILNVSAQGSSADETRRTVSLVVDRITRDLRALQESADAPSGSYIRATLLTQTPVPEPSLTNRARAAAVVAAGVLFLLASMIVVGDRVAARRRRRQVTDGETTPADPDVLEDGDIPGDAGLREDGGDPADGVQEPTDEIDLDGVDHPARGRAVSGWGRRR